MKSMMKAGILFFCLFVSGVLSAQEAGHRYALIIGNNSYRNDVTPLSNPANDAEDIAKAVGELGYSVTLKKNVTLTEMMTAIEQFTLNLSRDAGSEGFFWFAGHGLSIDDQHYLLPVDVNPGNDNMISRTSYSVDDLMGEIEKAKNMTNLVVIDACRNKVLPGNSSRSRSIGSRGLAVLSLNDAKIRGNKIVYSTAAGKTAADGAAGSRNSPFAEAFLHNLKSPQTFDDTFIDISQETLRLTRGEQEPYAMGTFAVKSYSLNPAGRQQVSMAQASPTAQAAQQALAVQVGAVSVAQGSLNINTTEAGQLTILINNIPHDFGTVPGYATLPITNINAGEHQAVMRYNDGHEERKLVVVTRDQISNIDFEYKIRPVPIPNAPSAASASEDAWKNKRLYIGAMGGGGGYFWTEERTSYKQTYNYDYYDYYDYYGYYSSTPYGYYSTTPYTENVKHSKTVGVAALQMQVQLWKYFAIEIDAGLGFDDSGEALPVVPILAQLTLRPSVFEICGGAGYIIGVGFGFNATLGIKLGTGVLFTELVGGVADANSVITGLIGYKFGLINK
jgi:hypothetical protein